jgi:hypothetical protein
VTFTTTLNEPTQAEIDFGPLGSEPTMVAPVDLAKPSDETYLLGMKPGKSYAYRVKLTNAAGSCTSEDYEVDTGTFDDWQVPQVVMLDQTQVANGFIVQTAAGGADGRAFILDSDGTVVWLSPSGVFANDISRAHLSWDARRLYVVRANPNNLGGSVMSMAMDGTDVRTLPNTDSAHHDLAAIPGGIAILRWNQSGAGAPSEVVELADDGTERVVLADVSSVYSSDVFHTNSLHYYERDDSYTLGDPDPSLYVKITRQGELVWQFGGDNPKDPAKNFSGVTPWQANHGHHLTAASTFAFFNNGPGFGTAVQSSAVVAYALDESTLTATPIARFTGTNSWILGDVQILPNDNYLITGSTSGIITELTPSGMAVMTLQGFGELGYSEFRTTLYGKPQY